MAVSGYPDAPVMTGRNGARGRRDLRAVRARALAVGRGRRRQLVIELGGYYWANDEAGWVAWLAGLTEAERMFVRLLARHAGPDGVPPPGTRR